MTVELKPILVHDDDEILNVISGIKKAKELIKTAGKQQKLLEQKLHNYMMEQEELVTIDTETGEHKTLVTWKYDDDGVTFDKESFQLEHPDLYVAYLIAKEGSRRLLIK